MKEKQKANIIKEFNKGRKKYIRNNTILMTSLYIGAMSVYKFFKGDLVTLEPGLPHRIIFQGDFFIGLATQLLIMPVGMYFVSKKHWEAIEKAYNEIYVESDPDSTNTTHEGS